MYNDYSTIGSFIGPFVAFSFLWSVAAWGACACFAAYLASQKGRCGLCWFVWGLIFGPLALITTVGLPLAEPVRPLTDAPAYSGADGEVVGRQVAGMVSKPGAGMALLLIVIVVTVAYLVGR